MKPVKKPKLRSRTDAEMITLLKRIAERLDHIFPVTELPLPVPAAPSKPRPPMRDLVSLVPHHRGPQREAESMGSLTQGGTDPERFWSRPDPYARELERPARAGRRQPVTR
jgi:hypothetical protein